MKRLLFILLFFIHTILSFSQHKTTSEDSLRGIISSERKCFDVYFYDLSVFVDINKKYIKGSNIIYFTATEDFNLFQLDLNKEMYIGKITDKNDSTITYSRKNNSIFI